MECSCRVGSAKIELGPASMTLYRTRYPGERMPNASGTPRLGSPRGERHTDLFLAWDVVPHGPPHGGGVA
jgi:hypothetical protein